MPAMKATSVTVGLPVASLEISQPWYDRVLDRTIAVEPAPHIVEYEVAGTWVQLTEGESTGNGWVLRVGVEDLADERTRLTGLGIAAGNIVTIPGVIA